MFPQRVASYTLGRKFTSIIKTLPLVPELGENDVFGSPDQVGLVSIRLIKTLGIEIGLNDGPLQGLKGTNG